MEMKKAPVELNDDALEMAAGGLLKATDSFIPPLPYRFKCKDCGNYKSFMYESGNVCVKCNSANLERC